MTTYTQGTWTTKPGHADAFVAAWTEFAIWSKTAFPTLKPLLMRNHDDPAIFVSIGPWPTLDMIAEWRSAEEFQAHIARIQEHVEGYTVTLLDETVDLR